MINPLKPLMSVPVGMSPVGRTFAEGLLGKAAIVEGAIGQSLYLRTYGGSMTGLRATSPYAWLFIKGRRAEDQLQLLEKPGDTVPSEPPELERQFLGDVARLIGSTAEEIRENEYCFLEVTHTDRRWASVRLPESWKPSIPLFMGLRLRGLVEMAYEGRTLPWWEPQIEGEETRTPPKYVDRHVVEQGGTRIPYEFTFKPSDYGFGATHAIKVYLGLVAGFDPNTDRTLIPYEVATRENPKQIVLQDFSPAHSYPIAEGAGSVFLPA